MGTNYYFMTLGKYCGECGRGDFQKYHIGKSSGGWCFGLHVIPKVGIKTWNDWKDFIKREKDNEELEDAYIVDEYGSHLELEDLEKVVEQRKWDKGPAKNYEWLKRNQACRGPNGLVRHFIDGKFCIGHGEGTWDYLVGEFS